MDYRVVRGFVTSLGVRFSYGDVFSSDNDMYVDWLIYEGYIEPIRITGFKHKK